MIITIDGPSGTGKSSVAKKVAEKLQFSFFDTGAMYRSIAWYIHHKNISFDNRAEIEALLPNFVFHIEDVSGQKRYFVHKHDVSEAIRTPQITEASSKVSAYPPVRKLAWSLQREFAKDKNAVFEGRDMGTVVFPLAEVKIFLTASPEVRARRRLKELQNQDLSKSINFDELLAKIKERDLNDSTRAIAPLKKAEDAVEMDTTHLTLDQVVAVCVSLIQEKRKEHDFTKNT